MQIYPVVHNLYHHINLSYKLVSAHIAQYFQFANYQKRNILLLSFPCLQITYLYLSGTSSPFPFLTIQSFPSHGEGTYNANKGERREGRGKRGKKGGKAENSDSQIAQYL